MIIVWKDTDEQEVSKYVNSTDKTQEEDDDYVMYDPEKGFISAFNTTVINTNDTIDMAKLYFNDYISFKKVNYVWGRYLGYYTDEPLSYNFTGLRNASRYQVYYVGISDNPRFMINRTSVFVADLRTLDQE